MQRSLYRVYKYTYYEKFFIKVFIYTACKQILFMVYRLYL